MANFIEPIRIATFVFPLVAFFLTLPITLFQYRKKGSLSFFYNFIIFTFIYYMMVAYFLVILPIPDVGSVTTTYRQMMQLTPFQFVFDIIREVNIDIFNPSSYFHALLQPVVTQVIFNILLTIPFGVFMRYFFNLSFKKTLLFSFGLSLFYELSQLSGLFFIYRGPYRLFDVDDLMLNTLGGSIGYLITPYLTVFLPDTEKLDLKLREKAQQVSLVKRFVIFIADITIINIIQRVISTFTSLDIQWIIFILYFSLLPLILSGHTLVSRFLKVRLKSTTGPLSIKNTLPRSLIMYFFIYQNGLLIDFLLNLSLLTDNREVIYFLISIIILWIGFNIIYWIYVIIKKPQQFFYDRICKTYLESNF